MLSRAVWRLAVTGAGDVHARLGCCFCLLLLPVVACCCLLLLVVVACCCLFLVVVTADALTSTPLLPVARWLSALCGSTHAVVVSMQWPIPTTGNYVTWAIWSTPLDPIGYVRDA